MTFIANSFKVIKNASVMGSFMGACSGTANFLGRTITHSGIGVVHGIGYGVAFGAASSLTAFFLRKVGINDYYINFGLSVGAGTAAAYGASAAAASLGLVAAPITIPGAIALTASSLALGIIINFAQAAIKDKYCPNKYEELDEFDQIEEIN